MMVSQHDFTEIPSASLSVDFCGVYIPLIEQKGVTVVYESMVHID